jgi:hypothetical protein
VACTTYLMRIAHSIGSLQDHFCNEDQDMKALQIVVTSILDLQVSVTDQLHKNMVYLFTSISLLRRDLYLGALHSTISNSATAKSDLRHASLDGDTLFGDSETEIIKDIISYTGELIKIKHSSPRRRVSPRPASRSTTQRSRPGTRRPYTPAVVQRSEEPRRQSHNASSSAKVKPFSSTRQGRGRGRGGQKR